MKDIEVSGKHIKLRFVIFIIAVIVSVAAFAFAIYQITNKKTGYYEIRATNDETAPLYSSGYAFFCYIDGKSDEIKANTAKIQSLYSESLGRIARLLDPRETYEGYVNLATLNQSPGQDVKLPTELYGVLTDAIARCEEGGFRLFDGAEKALWQELLFLEEPQPFDPVNDPDQKERMQAAWAAILGADAPKLTVVDAASCTVRLDVPSGYREMLERYEIEAPIIDLGVLREAYSLQYLRQKLIENGITEGYLRTENGMTMLLPDTENGAVELYTFADGEARAAAAVTIGRGAACCQLRAFSLGEKGYYTVDDTARHPYLGPDGEPSRTLLTVWTYSSRGDIVDAAAKALSLFAAKPEETEGLLTAFGTKQTASAVIAADAPTTIVSDPLHAEMIGILGNAYTISVPAA